MTSLFVHHTASFLPLHNQLTLELLKPGGLCQPLFCPAWALRGPLAPIRVGATGRGWGWGLRMEPLSHPHSLQDLKAEYFSGTPGRPAHPCPPQLWPEARSSILQHKPEEAAPSPICPLSTWSAKTERGLRHPQPQVKMLCLAWTCRGLPRVLNKDSETRRTCPPAAQLIFQPCGHSAPPPWPVPWGGVRRGLMGSWQL